MLIRGDWSAESGYRAGLELAAAGNVTAVFVANDQMALGALRAFSEAGMRVPEDISVVGYDDQPEAAYLIPPLTTVTRVSRNSAPGVSRCSYSRWPTATPARPQS